MEMLKKFTVKNYKNFRDGLTLDFTKIHDYKFNEECVRDGLLNKILVYGRNASGKSNLGYAIFDIVPTLKGVPVPPQQAPAETFVNADSESDEVSFTYIFQGGDGEIQYSYVKTHPRKIVCERLLVNGVKLFDFDYRSGTKDVSGLKAIGADSLNVKDMNGDIPMLRYIANNTPQKSESPVRFIMDFVERMLFFRSSVDGNQFISYAGRPESIESRILDQGLVKELEQFLNEVAGLDIKLGTKKEGPREIITQEFEHHPLSLELVGSSGTVALELYFYWTRMVKDASFIFIDEFDAFYHFELAEAMLKHIVKNIECQVILTSHNANLADNGIMRPDCYLQLSNGRVTSFADSTSRELREGHNLAKMLRNGEFDVRPRIQEEVPVHRRG